MGNLLFMYFFVMYYIFDNSIFFSNCLQSILPRVNTVFFSSRNDGTQYFFFFPRSLMLRIIKTAPQWRRRLSIPVSK